MTCITGSVCRLLIAHRDILLHHKPDLNRGKADMAGPAVGSTRS
jgi:hypothetical protein